MTDRNIADLMESLEKSQPSDPVELIETHISWVVLQGDRVWKIKKPMHYAFLDFSSLEARERYCRREVELNRRLAPQMYLGVVAIYREGDAWSIGKVEGNGKVVEFAVEMMRMKEEMRLDRLMEAYKMPAEKGRTLAREVSRFHHKAKSIFNPERSQLVGYLADFEDINSVRAEFVRHLGEEAAMELDAVVADSIGWLKGKEVLLQERLNGGWIRDGHGDLHTRNIFAEERLSGTEFVIFDCIEFNDAFREIDVLSEIAFLYMDVEIRGELAFGEAFLNEYLNDIEAIHSVEERELFNYFRRYRANVRAKVNALRTRQAVGNELDEAVAEMRLYLDLMKATRISE